MSESRMPTLAEVMERCYPPLTEAERRAAALPLNGGNHFGPGNCGEGKDCPHCPEDAEILEERIAATVKAVEKLSDAMSSADVHESRRVLTDALRDLIREARR